MSPSQDETTEPDSIWIPVFIFSATAVIVLCMCLIYFLYQRHYIKNKKNDAQLRMEASQNANNNDIISPPQNPVVVPDHPSMMEMAGQRLHAVPVLLGNNHIDVRRDHIQVHKHYLQWTGEEFLQWIMRLNGGRYMCYVQIMKVTFVEHQVCGAMIPYLNDEWWMKLGVSGQMDRLELMSAVKHLVGRGEEEKKDDDDVLEYEVEGNANDVAATRMNRRLHAHDDDDDEGNEDMYENSVDQVYMHRTQTQTTTRQNTSTPSKRRSKR